MICSIAFLNNSVKYFYFEEKKETMKRARSKPLRCLSKRQWHNLVTQHLESHSLLQRHCLERSESENSLSDNSLSRSSGAKRFYSNTSSKTKAETMLTKRFLLQSEENE